MFKYLNPVVKTLNPGMRAVGAMLVAGVLVSSCGDSSSTQTITETRSVSSPAESTMPGSQQPTSQAGLGIAASASLTYAWDTPEGWQQLSPTSTRMANFKIGEETECYVTALPGGGGGTEANVNRWRKQMSLADYTPEEFAALSKKPVLDKEAIFVDFGGTYIGMGGTESKADYGLLGAVFEDGGNAVFVKMVGPKSVVEAERERFNSFCQSLKRSETAVADSRFPEGHPDISGFAVDETQALPEGHPDISGAPASGDSQLPEGHPDMSGAAPAAGSQLPAGHPPIESAGAPGGMSQPAVLTWTAPDTWKPAPDKAMRLVTFKIGESEQTECYVTSVSKAAGGVDANINLLRKQMGQQELDAAGIEALPKVTVLGQPSPFLEIQGAYSGMDGTKRENYLMYAVVSPASDRTVFVKLTGPEAEVKAERDRFVAFCESLKTP